MELLNNLSYALESATKVRNIINHLGLYLQHI